jgi:PleD family two-component response regulator
MPEAGRVTLSAGVAEFRRGDSVESLLARADAALYRAKAAGRNRVESDPPPVEIDPHGVQESSP